MDPRLIRYFNDELQHLRKEASEFAEEYGGEAKMLSLRTGGKASDPYVERLLEGVAFLAARVRLKLDAQYPVLVQQLIDVLFPGWLAPSPSACVLRLHVDRAEEDKLMPGVEYPKGSRVRATLTGGAGLRCDFVTTRTVKLQPLALATVQYAGASPGELQVEFPGEPAPQAQARLRIGLELIGKGNVSQLKLSELPLYVAMPDPEGSQLLELAAGRCVAVCVSGGAQGGQDVSWLHGSTVRHIGFDAEEALFPTLSRGHAACRVLREYAALPEKFRFFELTGLGDAVKRVGGNRLWIDLYLADSYPALETKVKANDLSLFCVPAVNLSKRDLDRIDVQPGEFEYRIVGDANDLRRYEPVQITRVEGVGANGAKRPIAPVFEVAAQGRLASDSYYTTRRERRRLSEAERGERKLQLNGLGDAAESVMPKLAAGGSELFLSLAEAGVGPQGMDLQFLSVTALCMEREIPTVMAEQSALARYSKTDTVPIERIDCVAGPSRPLDYAIDGFDPWLVLSHLNLNHLSLLETTDGVAALRSMLELYAPEESQEGKSHPLHRQAQSIESIKVEQVRSRLPHREALAFGQGLDVTLTMNNSGFGGGSPFVLASLIEHFLASHVSINSFVRFQLKMPHRSEPLVWKRAPGQRPTL